MGKVEESSMESRSKDTEEPHQVLDAGRKPEEEIERAVDGENFEDTVETLEELVEMDHDDTTTKNPPTHPNIIHNKGEPEKGNAQTTNIPTEEIPTADLGAIPKRNQAAN